MDKSIEKNIQRIQRLGLSCSIKDGDNVRYFHNGHEYVEIGGIKWATMNVGAEKPTDSGLYFAWGETKGYTAAQVRKGERKFNWSSYKYGDSSPFKYNGIDNKTVLDSCDDAVTMNWGNGWRMPTTEEFEILINSTVKIQATFGCLLIDKKDDTKKLFFPFVGYYNFNECRCACNEGLYLSNTLSDFEFPFYLLVRKTTDIPPRLSNDCYRCRGFSIRAVGV